MPFFSDIIYSKPSNEPISYITGLQPTLNGKVNSFKIQTPVLVSVFFTDTIHSKPTNEPISYITGLQTELNGKVNNSQVLTPVPLNAAVRASAAGARGFAVASPKPTATESETIAKHGEIPERCHKGVCGMHKNISDTRRFGKIMA